MPYVIRPINPHLQSEIELVAVRMQKTLIEVLGEERGTTIYSMEWLIARVLWHLDVRSCLGQVFVLENASRELLGHIIVREQKEAIEVVGLFSTIYVEPAIRRAGAGKLLIEAGEEWFSRLGLRIFQTYTSDQNTKLIRLFQQFGYALEEHFPSEAMVRLVKRIS